MSQQSSAAPAFVTSLTPEPDIKDPVDTLPHDYQPPGVDDEEDFPQSLEEALTG
tara:strand:- start:817 stop:978 length:162 start_codon:yes stop_codon:yes gene_type:complete